MAVAEENMSVVVRGEKVLISLSLSLSLPLDSRLSFLRAIAGNELVGKSAVTLVTSGLRLRSGDLNGLLTHTIRAHNRHSPEI